MYFTWSWVFKSFLSILTTIIPILLSSLLPLCIYVFTCHYSLLPSLFDGMCLYYAGDIDYWFIGCCILLIISQILSSSNILNQNRYLDHNHDVWCIPELSPIICTTSLILNRKSEKSLIKEERGNDCHQVFY